MHVTRVTNKTTGTVIADRARMARSMWARFRGLMLSAPLEPGEGLVIEPCNSIHMMFMRFPIDAVFYNRDHEVTRVAHGVPRWVGLALGGRGARGVIELPVGAAEGVEAGHVLAIDTGSDGQGTPSA